MADPKRFEVGDWVWLVTDGSDRGNRPVEVRISKVGRTNGYFKQYGRDNAFALETGRVKENNGWARYIRTQQEQAAVLLRAEHLEALKQRGIRFDWQFESRIPDGLVAKILRAVLEYESDREGAIDVGSV